MTELRNEEFFQLRDYIHALCGLVIQEDKKYLVLQRIEPLLSEFGCDSFGEFAELIRKRPSPYLQERIIEAITTHETFFFRDEHPFATFRGVILPELSEKIVAGKQQGKNNCKARIWCAGASTGQEPYSLAIIIYEYLETADQWEISTADFSILATDISSRVLTTATRGIYNQVEISRGLDNKTRDKYFKKLNNEWLLAEHIRNMVEFRKMNLVYPFRILGEFDLIFCRNVLIYFDNETKRRILDDFHSVLKDDGYLLLGASETLYNLYDKFESQYVENTILYVKKDIQE